MQRGRCSDLRKRYMVYGKLFMVEGFYLRAGS